MIERYSRPEMVSLWDPEERFRRMLEVEAVWLEVLARDKRIPASQIRALRRVILGGPLGAEVAKAEAITGHDVVALLQVVSDALKGKAPQVVRYLHYGLTSSDVLDTALAMQMRDAADLLCSGWRKLRSAVRTLSRRHAGTWMVGRTHGIHAEPTTFGLKLAGWYAEAGRCLERMERAKKTVSYGNLSGAVGTFAHFPPKTEAAVLRRLGLKPEPVSTQVVPRDRHAELFSALALSAAAIERFSTEIRHLQRTEVLEAEEPFGKGQKGSSAMPHKRNPILSENLCGLARVVRGAIVPALENIALWHERDISHSSVERVLLPDATVTLDFMLHRFIRVIKGLQVYPERMRVNLESSLGLVYSQSVLLALIDRGLGRMDAYRIVQRAAMRTWKERVPLRGTLLDDPELRRHLSAARLDRCFDLKRYRGSIRKVMRRAGVL